MSVQLLAVKFNHDPNSATADALNLRKNFTQFVNVPEWQRGVSVNPEDSPAAYALAQVQGNTVTIQAKFKRLSAALQTVEVRAVDAVVDPPGKDGCLGIIMQIMRIIIRALFGNVLGEVAARSVTFGAGGETGFETFQLQNTKLDGTFVGIRTTTWRWQYRANPSDPWIDFDTSTHRVYLLLDTPTAPWQQLPYTSGNTQLPWTEVLDYACNWGMGTTTAIDTACEVTRNVYQLGPGTVTYDCPGGGNTHYASPTFNCTAFLDRLRGGVGNGYYVNCSDCATFVSTFANVLGCDLWQSRMSGSWGFGLNPMLGIGSTTWQPACGWSSFNYHEVAWTGACGVNDRVYDACLQVDGDADPTAPPHTALLPCNMRFGNTGDGDYRDRLATPAGRPNCNPQPATQKRRAVI